MAGTKADRDDDLRRLGWTAVEARLARALGGAPEALEEAAAAAGGDLTGRHRAGAALYLRARRLGLETPAVASWRRQHLGAAAHHLRLRAMLEEVAGRLASAGVEWLPLKGYDLATRLYDAPEERPTGDLDLLIPSSRLEDALRVLRAAGWRSLYPGPRGERFLLEEGYAWMAVKPQHPLLEIHFRLWGVVPEGLAAAVFERSRPDPSLPAGGRRLTLADAYLVAAVHVWLGPRYLVAWWDLARLSARMGREGSDAVVRAAGVWDVQLPVLLAARVSAALWSEPGCRHIERRLAGELRLAERLAAALAGRRLTRLPLAVLQAGRLLAGRRCRHRWRGPWRRLWPHPGIVERSTPEGWPWPARRLWFQGRRALPLRQVVRRDKIETESTTDDEGSHSPRVADRR